MVIADYSISTILNDLRRELFIKDLWNLTRNVLVLVEFGTPFGLECINNAKKIILRTNKKCLPEDAANVIAPDPHNATVHSKFLEYYIFEKIISISNCQISSHKLLPTNNHTRAAYCYLIVVRGEYPKSSPRIRDLIERSILDKSPCLLSNIDDSEIALASFSWPRILDVTKRKSTDITLKLSTPQGEITHLDLSKKEGHDPAVLFLAHFSRKGGLWPLPSTLAKYATQK